MPWLGARRPPHELTWGWLFRTGGGSRWLRSVVATSASTRPTRSGADLRSICRCGVARVRRLAFGAGDYTLDLAMQWGLEETELQHARSTLALESRAAGLERPIDSPFLKVNRAPKHRAQCRTNHSYNCRRR